MIAGLIKGTILTLHFSLPLKDPVLIFSLVLFIILLAPVILRKLRIPSLIGLIIAGVVIGPYGFNLIQRDSSIQLFGTVGLLYIMFLAGLELDLNEFKRNKGHSLLFGVLTFSLPFGLGIAACTYILHFPLETSILIASMFSTHTLVSYPIASKLGITKNPAVTIAVGGTIITDTVVLLILAVITGAAKGTLSNAFWIKLGISLLIFVAIVFILFPIIGKWFFRNMKGDNVLEYIFVLAMVFLAGFLAEAAGVEAIIGAFFAGLALNKLIPHTSPIMNRIDFVGNALFIPFFLIGVGMLVDLRVLGKGPEALVVAATLTIVAFAGKWLAAFFTQKIYKFSKLQQHVIFGLTSSHAAATLAVILVGYNIGLVNDSVLNGTIILILITCLVSSFITENAGRKIVLQEAEILPSMEETKERILVPISNPTTIESMMDFAIMMKDKKLRQPIYALTIVRDDDEATQKVQMSKKMLEKVIKHASATDTEVQVGARVDMSIASGITRAVIEENATDLIIGWNPRKQSGEALFGTKLGSILERVWKTVYVCHFIYPLNTNRKMIVAFPQYAEYEMGFIHIVKKILKLAGEMGVEVVITSTPKTQGIFSAEVEKLKSNIKIQYMTTDEPGDLLKLSSFVTHDDLFIAINARKGTISFDPAMEGILVRINRIFQKNNFMIIYPEQHAVIMKETGLQVQDVALAPIQEQLENITRLGRIMKKIFQRKDDQKAIPDTYESENLPDEGLRNDGKEKTE